ncbi:MAG: DUF2812 domain-containing protein [Thermotogae bacterium]|nr:DUF2812 domain-containing protein [Thermotogota bacterium]
MKEKKYFKFWHAANFEKIEKWLEEMAKSGYILKGVTFAGMIFSFEKSEPKKISYCIDYQMKITSEYTKILSEDGWKIKEIGSGWVIASKEYNGKRPELYTDYESILERNKKYSWVFLSTLAPLALVFQSLIRFFEDDGFNIFNAVYISIALPLVILYLYIFMRLFFTNKTLRKKIKERK